MTVSVKDCFTSRWEDGLIIEVDYSQLEVIGAAIVSGDKNMREDILSGIDSHSQSAAWLNPEYTYEEIREGYLAEDPKFDKMRKAAKAPRFELQYGAGWKSIAANNNLTEGQAKGFIERYYDRYSTLKAFQDAVIKHCNENKQPSEVRTKGGHPCCKAKWQSKTGRIYTFTESESPQFMQERGEFTSFSPTQIKNYPMQGFATGDIMLMMIGGLPEVIYDPAKVGGDMMPIATIHDSVLFDYRGATLQELQEDCKAVEEYFLKAPEYMEEVFGIVTDLPFSVDIEAGYRWSEVKRVEY